MKRSSSRLVILAGPSCVGKSPLGDARRALDAFVALLTGEYGEVVETWEDSLLP